MADDFDVLLAHSERIAVVDDPLHQTLGANPQLRTCSASELTNLGGLMHLWIHQGVDGRCHHCGRQGAGKATLPDLILRQTVA